MTFSLRRDLASETLLVPAGPRTILTAAGAGDNTLVNGVSIDTTLLTSPTGIAVNRYNSVLFALPCWATLTAAATLIVTGKIQTCAVTGFGSGVVDLTALATLLTLNGGGGGVQYGIAKMGISLENALQFIRCVYTPDLSAGATDTGDISSLAIFGGPQELP